MIVGLLVGLLLLQSILLIYPMAARKFGRMVRMTDARSVPSLQKALLISACRMASSRRVSMSFNDEVSLYVLLAGIKNRIFGNRLHHEYAHYNFPIAYLLIGLLDHHVSTGDMVSLKQVLRKSEELVDRAGEPSFQIDKIDQATFGLLFLRLFEITDEPRYLIGAHRVKQAIQRFKREDGLYRYRLGLDIFFIDTVGLLCPFLVRYAEVTGDNSALVDARCQVRFALDKCVEPNRGLAIHAFDLMGGHSLGSVNWARGMGWLLLGIAAIVEAGGDPDLQAVMHRYATLLEEIQGSGRYWPQFLGHTNDEVVDSSGTLMFLHSFQQSGVRHLDAKAAMELAALFVDRRGRVVHCSGDTIYINKYSRIKGPSELSQGLLLSILARVDR